jgi:hypothetical protein
MATEAHMKPGAGLDQAYDTSKQSITDTQTSAQNFSKAQVADSEAFAGGMTAAVQAGTAANVAQANQASALYGQSAKAAEEAAARGQAAATNRGASGANMVDMLRGFGIAQSNMAPTLVGANEARRGEARTKVGEQYTDLVGTLADLRAKRGSEASELSTKMTKDKRDYLLALDTLGQRDKDSERDYDATIAGIAAQDRQRLTNDANADADRTTRVKVSQAEIDAAMARVKAGDEPTQLDLARFDVNKNGRLDPGEATALEGGADAVNKSKGATIYVGRGGTAVDTSPSNRQDWLQSRARLGTYMRKAIEAASTSKGRNVDELRRMQKDSKLKDGLLWELAINYAVAKKAGDRTPIDRKFLTQLQTMFPAGMGELPADIAKLIDK